MSVLQIKRVLETPATIEPSTMYLVRSNEPGLAELYISNTAGDQLRRLLTKADVQTMLATNVASGATRLATPRSIAASGDATWTVTFDGSANVTGVLTLADTGIAAGEYVVTTVDSKGRTMSGRNLTPSDIPSIPGSKINSDIVVNTTGNAATASTAVRLTTARNINGVPFNGTADITISAVDTATPRIAATEKGVPNGVATLDSNGLIPSGQLPSFVDDVLEFAALSNFPGTGESGKIYVALNTSKVYRWTGSSYLQIPGGVGEADKAYSLMVPRTIAVTGDASWSVNFDGSANVSGALTLANSGIAAGEYIVTTVDSKGRATAGRALVAADVPVLDFNKVTSAQGVKLAASEW